MPISLTQEQLNQILKVIYSDTPDGYCAFYNLITDNPIPDHARAWIETVYEQNKLNPMKMGFIEAFRGSTKTATFTTVLTAYKTGLYPNKTSLLVQSGDDSAVKNTAAVANIIESNVMWKEIFPNVVPDKERGWSSVGYNVKRTDIDYGQWVRGLSKDPSISGFGYTSNSIIGMHPSNLLLVDDIHNEENSRSALEKKRVKTTYSGTIMPTRSPHYPLTLTIGTPWADDDLYADIKATNSYFYIKTPVRLPDGSPTWPDGMGEEQIKDAEATDITGGVEFARMYMLDLSAMKKRVFQYQTIKSTSIEWVWPTWGGNDYASVADPRKRDAQHSHFGLAYVAKSPYNTAIVVDGVLEQISMGEGLVKVRAAQNLFPNWQWCEIEGDGKGEEFYQYCMTYPDLRVNMSKSRGVEKARRLVNGLGMWLRLGKVLISDASTPFLNGLRNFLNKYPNVGEHDPGWDAADSVYRALVAMPDVLQMEKPMEDISTIRRRQRLANPIALLAKV